MTSTTICTWRNMMRFRTGSLQLTQHSFQHSNIFISLSPHFETGGWSHRPLLASSDGISCCSSVKSGGTACISQHNSQQFYDWEPDRNIGVIGPWALLIKVQSSISTSTFIQRGGKLLFVLTNALCHGGPLHPQLPCSLGKVDMPNSVIYLNQTSIFEWYVVWCGSKIRY